MARDCYNNNKFVKDTGHRLCEPSELNIDSCCTKCPLTWFSLEPESWSRNGAPRGVGDVTPHRGKATCTWHAPAVGGHVTLPAAAGVKQAGDADRAASHATADCGRMRRALQHLPIRRWCQALEVPCSVYIGGDAGCEALLCTTLDTGRSLSWRFPHGVVLTGSSPLVPRSRCRAASAAARPAGFPIKIITKRFDRLGPAGSLSSRRGRYR